MSNPKPTWFESLINARINFSILGYFLGTGHLISIDNTDHTPEVSSERSEGYEEDELW